MLPSEQLKAAEHSSPYKLPWQQLQEAREKYTNPQVNTCPLPSPVNPPGSKETTEEEAQDQLYPPLPDIDEDDGPLRGVVEPSTVSLRQGEGQGGPQCPPPLPRSWELPPATVIVQPRNAVRFWDQVRKKVLELGNWELTEA